MTVHTIETDEITPVVLADLSIAAPDLAGARTEMFLSVPTDDTVLSITPPEKPQDSAQVDAPGTDVTPRSAEERLMATIDTWSDGGSEISTLAELADTAEQIGLRDTAEFAQSWRIIMNGAIVSSADGGEHVTSRAAQLASDLISRHRRFRHTIAMPVDDMPVFASLDEYSY